MGVHTSEVNPALGSRAYSFVRLEGERRTSQVREREREGEKEREREHIQHIVIVLNSHNKNTSEGMA